MAYKCQTRANIKHNTTYAEFTAAIACAKTSLYLLSILDELGLKSENSTVVCDGSVAAAEMADV